MADAHAAASEHADAQLLAMKRRRGGRERLQAAALDLFRRYGVAGTSVQMIATRLGMTKAAVYHHFRSKEEIFSSLVEPVLAHAGATFADIDQLSDSERPRVALDRYADLVVRHRDVVRTVLLDPGTATTLERGPVRDLVEQLAALLAGGETGPAATARAHLIIYGFAAAAAESDPGDEDALGTELRRLGRRILPVPEHEPQRL